MQLIDDAWVAQTHEGVELFFVFQRGHDGRCRVVAGDCWQDSCSGRIAGLTGQRELQVAFDVVVAGEDAGVA